MVPLLLNSTYSFDVLLSLPLAQLVKLSAEESRKYIRKEWNDPSVILALFYRTCGEGEEASAAWAALYTQYAPLVISWISCVSDVDLLLQEETMLSLVNSAFTKFALSLSPSKVLQFPHVGSLINYLKRCTQSVCCDLARQRKTLQWQNWRAALIWDELRESDTEASTAYEVAAQVEQETFIDQFWSILNACLHDDRERLLVRLTYLEGMRPTDICRLYPTNFQTVCDVQRLKSSLKDRLGRSRTFTQFLASYGLHYHRKPRVRRKRAS